MVQWWPQEYSHLHLDLSLSQDSHCLFSIPDLSLNLSQLHLIGSYGRDFHDRIDGTTPEEPPPRVHFETPISLDVPGATVQIQGIWATQRGGRCLNQSNG